MNIKPCIGVRACIHACRPFDALVIVIVSVSYLWVVLLLQQLLCFEPERGAIVWHTVDAWQHQ
jgi:hypothetical protein